MKIKRAYLEPLLKQLAQLHVQAELKGQLLMLQSPVKALTVFISTQPFPGDDPISTLCLPLDQIVRQPEKVLALIQSKLGLNQKVFARNCEVRRVPKTTAEHFLKQYHLLNATQSAWNYGLYYHQELTALASFSKGRKMHRLPGHLRSYELIRFCSKKGITVTGGLSKLLKAFIQERHPGDIMTYVDAQWSDGESFVKAGFKKTEEAAAREFLVNHKTFERKPRLNDERIPQHYYLSRDSGNIKLIYHVGGKL